MRVLQVLPELNAGGVERGTVEFARYLVAAGHDSWVMSAGGAQVASLEQQGSHHVQLPVHRKSLLSLRHVPAVAKAIDRINPDVIHVRSRLPAWLVYLAVGRRPRAQRPAIVSTFHGAYSVNRYSAIMARADGVIAISNYILDYIQKNYPEVDSQRLKVIHRGVDLDGFQFTPESFVDWCESFDHENPQIRDRQLIVMPGRLSRWKGQNDFIDIIEGLSKRGLPVAGMIVGAVTPGKEAYRAELVRRVKKMGLSDTIIFCEHRTDIAQIFARASLVCNLSQRAEPFGRTVIEALAIGTPVLAYNNGGPAESLLECLPQGLVQPGNIVQAIDSAECLLRDPPEVLLPELFTLNVQARKTLDFYYQVVHSSPS